VPSFAAVPYDPVAEAERQWREHGWEDAALGMATVISTIRAERIFSAKVRAALEVLNLTFVGYEILMMLHFSRNGSMPLGKLGARMRATASSVTNACDRIEELGCIKRRTHTDDGRTILSVITPKGRKMAVEATKRLNEALFETTGFTQNELRSITDLFTKLRYDYGDFEDSEGR
jgi:DNA-binding MarR family transcriptional regulator